MPSRPIPSPDRPHRPAPRRGRPPRLEARGDILEALGELLAVADIDAISVENIVRRAGVSRATFYKHFDSRDHALVELFTEVADGIREEVLDAMRATGDPRTFIENGIRAYLHALTNLGRLAPAFDMAQYRLPEMYQRREETIGVYVDEVTGMLDHAGLPPVPAILLEGLIAAIDRVGQRIAAQQAATGAPADIEGLLEGTRRTLAAHIQLVLESS